MEDGFRGSGSGGEADGGEDEPSPASGGAQLERGAEPGIIMLGGHRTRPNWTPQEDLILLQHVAKHGTRNWGSLQISGLLPIRDQKACCNRFILLKKRCIKDKRSLSQLLQRAKDAVIHDAARNVNAAAAGAAGSSFVAGAAQASSFHHASLGSPRVAGGFAGSSPALHAAAAALNPLEALTSPSIGINSQSRVSFKGGGVAQQQQQVQEISQNLPLDGLLLDEAHLAWLKQAHIEAQRFTLSQVHASKGEGQGDGLQGGQQGGQQGGHQGGGNSGEEVGRAEQGAGHQRSECANDGRGDVAVAQQESGLQGVDAHKQQQLQQQQQQSASMSMQLANLRSQVGLQPGSLLAQALKLSHQPSFAAVSNLPLFSNFRSVTAPHSPSAHPTEPHASSPHAATLSSTSTVAAAAAAAPAGATVSAPNSSSPAWSEPAFPTVQSGEVTDRFSSFSDSQFASAAEIGATSSAAAASMMAAAASAGLDGGRSGAVGAGSSLGGSGVGGGLNSTLPAGGNDSGREGGSFTTVLRMSSAAFQHQQQQQMLLRQQWSGQAGGQESGAANAEPSVHVWRPREVASWFQQLGQSGVLAKLAGDMGGEGGEAEKSTAAPAAGGGAGVENQGFERGGGMLLLAEPATANASRHDVQREHQQEKPQSDLKRHDQHVDASNPPALQEPQPQQNEARDGTHQLGHQASILGLQQSRRPDAILEALTSGSQSWVGQAGRWVDEHQMQWRMQKAGENAAMGVGMAQAEQQDATHADNLAEAEILRALHAEMESLSVLMDSSSAPTTVLFQDDEEEETTSETEGVEGDKNEGKGDKPSEGTAEEGEIEEEEETEAEQPSAFGAWNLGSLLQTIATKSEEVLREYKQELQEFGEGLKKETEELVETTASTVSDLPSSLESGAQAAQSSLEGVGHTIEEFGSSLWKGTSEILASVKEAVAMVEEEVAANATGARPRAPSAAAGLASAIPRGKYSRYEALVSAMQRDSSTYCDEPEDTEDFAKWVESFDLKNREADVEAVLKDNAFMQELQSRIVPLIVERETFWTRYFYRLYRLQQAEDARADLVKRATTSEEEDLSWDVDDDADDAQSSPAAAHHGGTGKSDAAAADADAAAGVSAADDAGASAADAPADGSGSSPSVKPEEAVVKGNAEKEAAAGTASEAKGSGEEKDAGEGEVEKERDASSQAATSPQPGNVHLSEVKVPRLEDAGLEDTALPFSDIQAAFEIAARARPREPSNRSSSSDSSAGSEWQVVSKDDASKEDGLKASQSSAPAPTTVADAVAATSASDVSEPAALGSQPAAEPTTASASDITSPEGKGGKEEKDEKEFEAEERGGKGKKEGGDGEEDELNFAARAVAFTMADARQVGSLWTPEEDVILLQHVARYGTKHWGSLQSSSTLPHRDQKACCNRFILLKRKFFQARAKGQNLQTIFPYINVNSQPQSPSAAVASSMLHAPASPSSTEVALRVNVSSRVISKRAAPPSLSKPAILQSALATVQDQAANGSGSVWMPNLVDAQRSPAVSDPSSPLSAAHGALSLQQQQQKQQQQQLQQLLVTIGQSANAVSQAAMQFVNATSSVNSTSFPATQVNQQQPQSATSAEGQQSAADAVVNMILSKLAGDASGFAKHPVASAAAASPASSKSDVSVEPASAHAPSAPLLDASSRPSSAAPRRPSLLSASQRGPSPVVPSSAASAGSFPADSAGSLQQVVPGSEGETESDDDMLLAYLYAQGHAQATAPEIQQKEISADGAAVEVEKQEEQRVQQAARQEEAKQEEAMATDAADMALLMQLHEEVMVLEKLVAAGPSAASAAAAAPSATPAVAPASALAPLPPRVANASFSGAAASGAAVPLPRSASQRPDAFLEQVSSAPGRMLFGFSPVYDLMAPGASWDAQAAAGDAAGWDLKDMVDVSAFNLGASAAFLA
ncbi:unnamed protein product [Closterium sp. Yama58-4]|nr:unnamed protein product [Closterium sp. Yama58-4]